MKLLLFLSFLFISSQLSANCEILEHITDGPRGFFGRSSTLSLKGRVSPDDARELLANIIKVFEAQRDRLPAEDEYRSLADGYIRELQKTLSYLPKPYFPEVDIPFFHFYADSGLRSVFDKKLNLHVLVTSLADPELVDVVRPFGEKFHITESDSEEGLYPQSFGGAGQLLAGLRQLSPGLKVITDHYSARNIIYIYGREITAFYSQSHSDIVTGGIDIVQTKPNVSYNDLSYVINQVRKIIDNLPAEQESSGTLLGHKEFQSLQKFGLKSSLHGKVD